MSIIKRIRDWWHREPRWATDNPNQPSKGPPPVIQTRPAPPPMTRPNTKRYVSLIYADANWKWIHADRMEGPWTVVLDQKACGMHWGAELAEILQRTP